MLITWRTGNHSSYPSDGSAFIEADSKGKWWVYKTGSDGSLMEGFPRLRKEPFKSVEEAQAWVEARSRGV